LIALRAYFDSSGKLHNKWLTLAAIAALEAIWQDFDKTWDGIQDHNPKGSHIHMKEVFRLTTAMQEPLLEPQSRLVIKSNLP